MTPLLRLLFITGFFSLLMQPGKLHAQRDGGSCSYKTTIYPATIISVEVFDSAHAQITFVIARHNTTDTMTYYSQFRKFATREIIEQNDLRVGNSVEYVVKNMISGSCNPHIAYLTLKKFEATESKKK